MCEYGSPPAGEGFWFWGRSLSARSARARTGLALGLEATGVVADGESGEPTATRSLRPKLARPERLELPTPRFVVWCSIQLSYGRRGRGGGLAYRFGGRKCLDRPGVGWRGVGSSMAGFWVLSGGRCSGLGPPSPKPLPPAGEGFWRVLTGWDGVLAGGAGDGGDEEGGGVPGEEDPGVLRDFDDPGVGDGGAGGLGVEAGEMGAGE